MITTGQWKERGNLIELKGRKIFVIDEGEQDKEAIVLIHGFPTSSWDWWPVWSGLSGSHRVVAMDMLGFGYSDKPANHTYSIMEQADFVEAVVQELSLKSFDVLAHDYGDTVAQELLARQNTGNGTGKWKSVCFLNGGLFPETHQALLIQKLLLSPIGSLINRLSSKRSFDKSFSRVFGEQTKPSAEELDAFWTLINHNNGRHIFHKLITYMRDRQQNRERWLSALTEAKIPIALINGSVDPVSGAHMIARYREIVGEPDYLAELVTIGHYPQVEDPEAVLEHYHKFLKTYPK